MKFYKRTCITLLLIFIGLTKAFNLNKIVIKSHLSSTYSYYIVAPELFRNNSFAYATVRTPEQNKGKAGIDVSVTIADKYFTDDIKCFLTLRPDDADNSIIVTSLKRLGEKNVVLMGYEVQKDERRRKGFLIALDVKSCETLYLYSSFDLTENHVLVTRDTSEKFELFMNRRSPYRGCTESKHRITFKAASKETQCFDVDVSWSEIYVGAFSFSEDVVMVRGFDDRQTYKVLVYNTAVYPYRQQLWLTLPRVTNESHVVSSDLAVCWILNPNVDKSVHCSLIDKSGNLRLNKTINYDEPVRLLSISHSDNAQSQVILLTEKIQCDSNDCQDIFVSKVSDESIDHRTIKLECSAIDKKRLILDARQMVSKAAVTVEYICEAMNYLVLHSIDIDNN